MLKWDLIKSEMLKDEILGFKLTARSLNELREYLWPGWKMLSIQLLASQPNPRQSLRSSL